MGVPHCFPHCWRFWLPLIALILLIKLGIYLIDSRIGFVLHDSESYLRTALTGWIPPDRSWLYGVLIGWISADGSNLQALVWAQTLLSAGSCLLLAVILTFFLGCSRGVAMAAAAVCAVAPAQLLYERYVMAESFSLFAFGLFLITLLLFLRRGNIVLLVAAIAIGSLTGALRFAYLPVAFGLTTVAVLYFALLPLRAVATDHPVGIAAGLRKAAMLLLIMTITFGLCMTLERSPRQASDSGGFLLSAWSPLLAHAAFSTDPRLTPFLANDACPLTWENRARQHWEDGCLMALIRTHFQQQARINTDDKHVAIIAQQDANRFAQTLAIELLLHSPSEVLKIGLRNWQVLWDTEALRHILFIDSGGKDASEHFIHTMQTEFSIDIRERNQALSPIRRYFMHAIPWHWWVISSPLVLFLWGLASIRSGNPTPLLVASASLMLLLVVTIAGSEPSVRLYHGIAWLSLIGLADIIDRLINTWHARSLSAPGHPPIND